MNILAAFRRFWYVDTADVMQQKMLRGIPSRAMREATKAMLVRRLWYPITETEFRSPSPGNMMLGTARSFEPTLIEEGNRVYELGDAPVATVRAIQGRDPLFNPAEGTWE